MADNSKIEYTDAEKEAIKIYIGEAGGMSSKVLANSGSSYEILNAILFPGIMNELTRVFDDGKFLPTYAIEHAPEELLEVSTQLYSAMYKYGKNMSGPVHIRRADRSASFPEIERRGETVSNFSTTTNRKFLDFTVNGKKNVTLVVGDILPGTVCADFREILSDDYNLSNEREILVAPFTPVEYKEVGMKSYEKRLQDRVGNPPNRKLKMTLKPPQKAKPLTEEEKSDKDKQMQIFHDPDKKRLALTFLNAIQWHRGQGKTQEETMAELDPQIVDGYIEWKNAFQSVYRYNVREIALSLDRQMGLEENKKQSGIMGEFSELAGSRGFSKINNALTHFKSFAKNISDKIMGNEKDSIDTSDREEL